jgi:hypothetical protein
MDQQESAEAVKQRILQQLEASRSSLVEEAAQVREEYRPMAIASRSFNDHKGWWIAGGVVAGLVLIKLVLPSRSKKNAVAPVKAASSSGISSLVRGVVFAVAQRAVIHYVQDRVEQKLTPEMKETLFSFLKR